MSRAFRLPIAALIVSFLAVWPASTQAEQAKPAGWTPALMMQVKQVTSVQVSPDGKRVAFAVREAVMDGEKSEYVSQLHLANIDGSNPIQLTSGDKSNDSPQWSPNGEWIAFLSNRSGKKNLWLLPLRGGEAQALTDVKTAIGSFKWSPDGKSIAYVALDPPTPEEEKAEKEKTDVRIIDENIKMNRLYVLPVEKDVAGKREPRLLTAGDFNVGSGIWLTGYDWSPDGKTIAFTQTRSPKPDDWTTADISLVDVATAKVKPLVATKAAESAPLFSPDGKTIAFVASDDPPTWGVNYAVQAVSSSGGSPRPLAESFDKWPVPVGWSADGKKLYYTETRGTSTRLCALPMQGAIEEVSKAEGVLTAVGMNPTRTMVGFAWETAGAAPEAHVSRLDRFEPMAVSKANKDLPALPLGKTEVIRWKASDGLEIEGLLTYPVEYERGKRYPLLLVIHGGPMGVFTQRFIGSTAGQYPIAAFASRGYAVLRCNCRGSSGYGQKFRYANYKDWGGMDFKDLMAGVDHVVNLGVADQDRLGVMGWSYGGYMTSWTITQTKRFKAASVGAGVTNLMSFNGTADIPGFLPDYFGAEFWDNLETYRAHSAMFQVKGVSTPTLIQHGERDERVPISQGYELYNALKRQNCKVKMVVYPRTPHGIEEPKLLHDMMERNVKWFDEYVRGG